MNFIKGRDNLSVTVYVPYDCMNNCKFCTSKKEYTNGTNLAKVKEQLKRIRMSSIKEVVFTGGEPMNNIKVLEELIEFVNTKDVYINTTYIKTNLANFVKLVNNTKCIKGVNISRHSESFEKDSLTLNNIAEDEWIGFVEKPVKINVVIPDNKIERDFAKQVLARWNDFDNVRVCFRANFNNISKETLHDLADPNIEVLSGLGEFNNRGFCDVCDTVTFKRFSQTYSYHRGLSTTAISFGNVIQVNDIILFPNGDLAYDWDKRIGYIDEMCEQFDIEAKKDINDIILESKRRNNGIRMSCGGFSYGFGRC